MLRHKLSNLTLNMFMFGRPFKTQLWIQQRTETKWHPWLEVNSFIERPV